MTQQISEGKMLIIQIKCGHRFFYEDKAYTCGKVLEIPSREVLKGQENKIKIIKEF